MHDIIKVLVVTPDPNGGGSSQSLLTLLRNCDLSYFHFKVVLPRDGYLSNELDKMGIDYEIDHNLVLSVWPRAEKLSDKLLFFPRVIKVIIKNYLSTNSITKIVKSFSPDIIHSNSSLITAGYNVSKKLGIKHIWHIREYGTKDFQLTFFPTEKEKRTLLLDTVSIAITKGIKQHFKLGQTCHVIYNGIETVHFPCISLHKSNYYLYAGHVTKNKGVTDLVEAFLDYKKRGGNFDLLIVGRCSNDYRDFLEKIIKSSSAESHVKFVGETRDISRLLSEATAVIIPSYFEAFGRVLAEAISHGTLIIGRNSGGLKEQFDLGLSDNGNEIGFRFSSVKELTNCLFRVESLQNEEMMEIIKRGHKSITKHFSSEKYGSNITNLYEKVLNENVKTSYLSEE